MQKRNGVLATSVAIGALLTAAVVLVGCGGGSDVQSPPGGTPNDTSLSASATPSAVALAQKAGTLVDPAIVAADNGFGIRLLDALLPESDGANIAISPLSVALALQVVYNGAAGTTRTAMAQTLQLGNLSTQALNSDNAALQASLINPDPKVQLTIANSLWMHLASNPVSSSFTQTDETYYGVTLGDLSGAPDNVNAWAASETHDLITEILPPEPPGYYQQIIAVIANTIYFKGQWTAPFDVSQTAAAPFTLIDGTQTSAEMMHQTGSYPYLQETWHGNRFQAVRIPYGAGRLSMLAGPRNCRQHRAALRCRASHRRTGPRCRRT
jgi:serpin B